MIGGLIIYHKHDEGRVLQRNTLGSKNPVRISREKFLLEMGLLRGLGFKITDHGHKVTVDIPEKVKPEMGTAANN